VDFGTQLQQGCPGSTPSLLSLGRKGEKVAGADFCILPRPLILAVTHSTVAGGPEHSLRAILDRGGGLRGAAGPLVYDELRPRLSSVDSKRV
jgi:hypothetical protein